MSPTTLRENPGSLAGQLAQSVEPESFDQREEVDEVSGLGMIEQGEQLVGDESLDRQHRTVRAGFGMDAGVAAKSISDESAPAATVNRRSRD